MGPIFQVERVTFEIIPSNKSLARFLSKVKMLKYMFLYKMSFLGYSIYRYSGQYVLFYDSLSLNAIPINLYNSLKLTRS